MSRVGPSSLGRLERLLVALNATEGVDRGHLYRLAGHDAWLLRLGRGRPGAQRGGPSAQFWRIPFDTLTLVRNQLARFEEIAERERSSAHEAGAGIVTRTDPLYPRRLVELPLPPPVLYVRGEIPRSPAISIVGARRADRYGLEAAELFAREVASTGLTVVSGLARGIDSAGHRGALDAPGGRTVGVLGCGIDVAYPRGSASLATRMSGAGAVVTELPIAAPPLPMHFPLRNRIIAALGLGTLVVRAAPRSGSLITARLALELGRDVYALPGNIFDRLSSGPNSLIRDGALPAQHPREIIESLPLAVRDQLQSLDRAPVEPAAPDDRLAVVYAELPRGATISAKALADATGKDVSQVLGQLTELELGGWARRHPGPAFSRSG